MENNTLPTDDLKKYGIINEDNSFTKKLSAVEIQQFLQGAMIIADNQKNRVTFQLVENNSRLNVQLFEREKDLSAILEKSKNGTQYSDVMSKYNINENKSSAQLGWTKSAFLYDEKSNNVEEYDFLKNSQ